MVGQRTPRLDGRRPRSDLRARILLEVATATAELVDRAAEFRQRRVGRADAPAADQSSGVRAPLFVFSELQVTRDLPHACIEVSIPVFGGSKDEQGHLEREVLHAIEDAHLGQPAHAYLGRVADAGHDDLGYRVLRVITTRAVDATALSAAIAVATARVCTPERATHRLEPGT